MVIYTTISYFDLENPEDLAQLADPILALKGLKGVVIIYEVQRVPEIFSLLRVLVDYPKKHTGFLIPGSVSPRLLLQGSETLGILRDIIKFSFFLIQKVLKYLSGFLQLLRHLNKKNFNDKIRSS